MDEMDGWMNGWMDKWIIEMDHRNGCDSLSPHKRIGSNTEGVIPSRYSLDRIFYDSTVFPIVLGILDR